MTTAILLRDVIEADLPIFFEHQLDPDATEMAALPSRDKEIFMAHWAKIMADDSVLLKTVLFDGQVAGSVVSFILGGEREVGYWIGKKFWSKGIATQALAEFLNHIKTRPLYAHVAKHNIASRRVLEKCGFTVIGENKDFSIWDGKKVEGFILKLEA
jgi:RimJ/RimL family protein N-acetyltransferase